MSARPFFLLAERPGWRAAALAGAEIQSPGGWLRLRPLPAPAVPPADPQPVAVAADGTAYVLDRAAAVVRRRDPCTGAVDTLAGVGGRGSRPRQLLDPRGIALTGSGDLLLADTGNRRVQVLSRKGLVLRHVVGPLAVTTAGGLTTVRPVAPDDDAEDVWEPWDVLAGSRGRWYVSDRAHGLVHVFGRGATWLAAFDARAGGPAGAADAVAVGADGRFVRPAPGPPPDPAGYERLGSLVTDGLDSRLYRCEWDRLEMRASVPAGTKVTVETLTADTERSAAEIQTLGGRWVEANVNTGADGDEWSCMLRGAPGRFLWLRLTLAGDGAATPLVESVRVRYPRASSLAHLPAVFRADPVAADFLGRFLSIFDTIRGRVTETLEDLPAYLDPGSAPATSRPGGTDFLRWLASWIGVALDSDVPEATRRRLVEQAHRLYRTRGTEAGLRLHVRLCTGLEPHVLEHYKLRRWLVLGEGHLGDCSVAWGPDVVRRLQLDAFSRLGDVALVDSGDPALDPFAVTAHRFTVFVHRRHVPGPRELAALERVVAAAKPAHTQASIQVVEPRLQVGVQAFVGVSTIIGRYPAGVREGQGQLGRDTVLGPSPDESVPPSMRIGSRSRIGSSTAID